MNSMRRAYLAKTAHSSMEMGADPCGSKPFLRFVTPSDVRDLKNRVDPFVVSTDASVAFSFTRIWRPQVAPSGLNPTSNA